MRSSSVLLSMVKIVSRLIIAMVKNDPTTLYIYPESADIDAVTQVVKTGQSLSRAGLYWNASCLKEIGSPKFWSKKALGRSSPNTTRIIRYRRNGHRRFARGSEIGSCSLSVVPPNRVIAAFRRGPRIFENAMLLQFWNDRRI